MSSYGQRSDVVVFESVSCARIRKRRKKRFARDGSRDRSSFTLSLSFVHYTPATLRPSYTRHTTHRERERKGVGDESSLVKQKKIVLLNPQGIEPATLGW